jgi:hypothetical protein
LFFGLVQKKTPAVRAKPATPMAMDETVSFGARMMEPR